jgi:hypothetical protein
MRGGPSSKEVADRFVEALRRLEEDRDVEPWSRSTPMTAT